jgi:hypothetical protein
MEFKQWKETLLGLNFIAKKRELPESNRENTPTSPTRRLTNFHFSSFLPFSNALGGLTGGTKEPIPSPKIELHHEGIILLDCS